MHRIFHFLKDVFSRQKLARYMSNTGNNMDNIDINAVKKLAQNKLLWATTFSKICHLAYNPIIDV